MVNATMRENIPFAALKMSTSRPVTLKNPPTLWMTNAAEYVDQAHKQLLKNNPALNYLAARGLPIDAIRQYKIGWSSRESFFPRKDWGMEEESGRAQIWMPKGIVIPSIANGEIVRLKVRRNDWHKDDERPKYVAISGSMNGLSIIGNRNNKMMVVVESELDAYAIHWATQDFAIVVAVGSNIKNPDNLTDRFAKNVESLLICHDNDEAGQKMLAKWQGLYSHAKAYPTPIGKDVGEAIQKGLNIRDWFLGIVSVY